MLLCSQKGWLSVVISCISSVLSVAAFLRVLCRVVVSCSASDYCSVVSTGPEECCCQVQCVTINHAASGRQSVDEEGVDGACIRLPHYT